MVGIDPLSYGRWWVYKHPKLVLELNKVSMQQNFGWHELNFLGILISWLMKRYLYLRAFPISIIPYGRHNTG